MIQLKLQQQIFCHVCTFLFTLRNTEISNVAYTILELRHILLLQVTKTRAKSERIKYTRDEIYSTFTGN